MKGSDVGRIAQDGEVTSRMRTNGTLDDITVAGLRQLLSMASPRLFVTAFSLLSGSQLALSVRIAQALYVETFTDLLLRFFSFCSQ